MKYIIGTGWWCDGTGLHSHSKHQKYVDKKTRQSDFFDLWYKSVKKYTKPDKIIMVDSNSPIKPNLSGKDDVEFISLNKNYGAAIDGTSKGILSGWDRSVLMGASYAMLCDVDYFVYIEQDCLIHGKGIIEYAISKMNRAKVMLGDGIGTPQPIQQSFIIVKGDYLQTFISKDFTLNDKSFLRKSPEKRYGEYFKQVAKMLPFGYGRTRPINFNDEYFYAQHLRSNELRKFKNKLSK